MLLEQAYWDKTPAETAAMKAIEAVIAERAKALKSSNEQTYESYQRARHAWALLSGEGWSPSDI